MHKFALRILWLVRVQKLFHEEGNGVPCLWDECLLPLGRASQTEGKHLGKFSRVENIRYTQ